MMTLPAVPSMITVWPGSMSMPDQEMPDTAGISRERARMDTCEVLPPTSVVRPRVFLRLNWDSTEGVRLRLRMMTGSGTSR